MNTTYLDNQFYCNFTYSLLYKWQEAENIVQKIKQQQYQELLVFDQLNMERIESQVFLHFRKLNY